MKAVGLVVAVVLAGIGLGSSAEAAVSGRGLAISPAFQQVDIAANQPQVRYVLTLSNRAGVDQNFRLSVVDFGSLDEQGGVAFLGQPANELEHKYGLASWMKLEREAIMVPAGKSVQVVATIDNRASLAPGGHYAAVLATAVTEAGQPVNEPRVGVKQVLSSLVLVTKAGAGDADLRLVAQTPTGGWWRLPTQVEQRFQNVGNVHVVPRGVTEVRDMAGRVVARGALNDESGAVLPESFRRYKTPLVSLATAWLPGRYEVRTVYRYDGTDATKTLTTAVWFVGSLVIWLALGLLVALVGLGVWAWRRGGRLRGRRGKR